MGKQEDDTNIVEDMEGALGLGSDGDNTGDDNTSDTGTDATTTVQEVKEEETPKKDDNTTPETKTEDTKTNNNITVTPEQIEINKEITKVDLEIEALEKDNNVDENKFYDTLDEILTDEEQQLEHDNKGDYLKLVSKKKDEYIKANSKDEQIKELKEKITELNGTYQRQAAIIDVSAKYPNYNHKEVLDFFERKLNQDEKDEVFKDAESYSDVYENTYKKFLETNPANIQSEKTPNIPKVDNVRKESVKGGELGDGLKSEDERLQQALGLDD